jgi:copper(I)-binding protein
MKNYFKALLISLSIVASTALPSCNLGGTPEILVKSVKLIPSVVEKAPAAAFMLIVNDGDGSDSLLGVTMKEYPSVRGEIHDFIGGKMTQLEEVEMPALEITVLKRGTLHMMFFNVPARFAEEVTLLLQFKRSGTIEAKALVQYYKKTEMRRSILDEGKT